MDKFFRVCCSKEEIYARMEQYHRGIRDFRLAGKGWDYSVYFPELTESECDRLDDTFCDVYYGDGEKNIAGVLVDTLYVKGFTLATAESCSGGIVASSIVDISGCSEVFFEGLVTYSNKAKMDRLGVSEDTLVDFGAVSSEVAIEMASGLLSDNVQIGVSTTGIAGPQGGTLDKPVGLVYIAVVSDNFSDVYEQHFTGDRAAVRQQTKDCALFYALKHLQNHY